MSGPWPEIVVEASEEGIKVTVVGTRTVVVSCEPCAVAVVVCTRVVVYVDPAPATTTVVPPALELGAALAVGLMVLNAPVVTVAGGRSVVTVCVLASTQPTSKHEYPAIQHPPLPLFGQLD